MGEIRGYGGCDRLTQKTQNVYIESFARSATFRDKFWMHIAMDIEEHQHDFSFGAMKLRYPSNQGIGSWHAYHEFEPSTTKDPPCKAAMLVKSVELKRPPVGVVWKLGEAVPAQVSSTSIDHGSKLRGPSPKSPRVAEQCDVNIPSLNHT
ncbi:hypothetical protein TNCV_4368851 [Trichonephila clavipes]|nr:hypothetical protein TNCV_4368851 [Trichonephila clavipes]